MLLRITPGSTSEIVAKTLKQGQEQAGHGGQLALWAGLVVALVALTTSMGQVERGANRIYGIQRDRPARQKYGRAVLMALTAGLLSLVGPAHHRRRRHGGRRARGANGWQDFGLHVWQACGSRSACLLAFGAFAIIVERAPRRRQPAGHGWASGPASPWCCGSLHLRLSLYVAHSGSFGSTYGPLTGVMALLLWAYLASMALSSASRSRPARGGARRVQEPPAGTPRPAASSPRPASPSGHALAIRGAALGDRRRPRMAGV